MRATLIATIFLVLAASNLYSLDVTEAFVDDGVLGYWELTVINTESEAVYVLAVGNNDADDTWSTATTGWPNTLASSTDWDAGLAFNGLHADATAPNTAADPFATRFPGATQALVWWAGVLSSPIDPASSLSGFRYQSRPTYRHGSSSSFAGAPYAVYNAAGEVLATGFTAAALPVHSKTWGGIKALFQ